MSRIRLGVNVDHVATVRNARGGDHPDPLRAALLVKNAGGDGVTAHLREDRRHIRDDDIRRLAASCELPLNLEMAATEEMLQIALDVGPHACCLVPERRAERTTEAGLDVVAQKDVLAPIIKSLGGRNIRVSLFVDPERPQLEMARHLGAPVVELHTGTYAAASGPHDIQTELGRLQEAAGLCAELGLECHMGHGLDYQNVAPIAAISNVRELNIGHFLIGEAIFIGIDASIRKMRELIDTAVIS